jgi:hypothetical protein
MPLWLIPNVKAYETKVNPASLFLASSTSAIPGSASFQKGRNLMRDEEMMLSF